MQSPSSKPKVLLTGSSGLIGSALGARLEREGWSVKRLVRNPTAADSTLVVWDPESFRIVNPQLLEELDAVVHLAGENIAEARWTPEQKARIRNSRVQGTALLARSLAELKQPPRTFLSASGVGYYGHQYDQELTEKSPIGKSFLSHVCRDWEEAADIAAEAGCRVVKLRIGMVLSGAGGALAKMVPLFRWGLGGRLGSGRQYVSWIALDDLVEAILFCLRNESVSGVVNGTAPFPVSNAEFAAALGRALGRPARLPAPAFALRMAMGEMADELLLASTRALPAKLLELGFSFRHPSLDGALRSIFPSA